MIRIRQGSAKEFLRSHPRKSRASLYGIALGILTGCAGFPYGSTLRLVCQTATGILDVVEKSQHVDSGVRTVDAAVDAR